MAAKKKPTKKASGSDTPNKRMARAAAYDALSQYVDAPTNRAQVINPKGYIEGTDGFFMKTKGRFAVATKIADEVYKGSLDRLNKNIPEGSKPYSAPVKKTSTRGSKKKK
jgi:hypothetical protein